jgi:hypothetical protein
MTTKKKIVIYQRMMLSHSPPYTHIVRQWEGTPRNLLKARDHLEEVRAVATTIFGHPLASVWLEIGGQTVDPSWMITMEDARGFLSEIECRGRG